MDVGTGLALLGSARLVEKLLGPTADYIGEGIQMWAKKRVENVKRIFSIAARKLGNKLETEGGVPPRVLKGILDEGSFCDDALSAEYFGGVLASSRTGTGQDDRGATYINLIASLSTYQIRTHYILYTLLRRALVNYDSVIYPGTDRAVMCIYIPTSAYNSTMGLGQDLSDESEAINILAHSMNGLRRFHLVENFTYGAKEIFLQEGIKYKFSEFPIRENQLAAHGITFVPTPGGMELYFWVHGLGHYPHFRFLNTELVFDPIPDIHLPDETVILYEDFITDRLEILEKKA